MMREKQSYAILDKFRVFAAVLVVAIHTSPLLSYSESADFFFTRILGRIAVPFFFMVTGQFAVAGFLSTKKQFYDVLQYVKKIALLYGIAILIYLPVGIYAGQYEKLGVWECVRMLVFDGTFYHLWYFPACIIGVLLVYGMGQFMRMPQMLAAAGALYVVGLFGDSYYGLVEEVPVVADFYGILFQICSYTRNGVFLAPVFLLLGAWIAGRPKRFANGNVRLLSLILLLSFLAMTEEAFLLRHFKLQRHDSMYVALLPVMYFLYEALLACGMLVSGKKQKRRRNTQALARLLRTASTWVYILHPAIIVVVRGAAKVVKAESLLVENSLVHYLAVLAISLPVAFVIAVVLNAWKQEPFRRGRAWIELDRGALAANVGLLRSLLPPSCKLMPAVKADAYGHGALLMARELQKLDVDAFCVASVEEGAMLRKKGVKGEILVLGYTHPQQFGLLCRYHLIQTVIDHHYAVQLNHFGRKIHVHIGVDTGMHRLGERSENLDQIAAVYRMKNLVVDGVYTHLCVSDTDGRRDKQYTKTQAGALYQLVDALKAQGLPCPKVHLQASYGVLNYPDLAGDYARVGIALYGVLSTKEDTEKWDGLQPVLSLKARVATVKTLYQGESAGYGLQFTAKKDMKIAVLAIGYADGLPRALSQGVGHVLLHGQAAPIIGRICMDQTLVDISSVGKVRAGDVAVLIGYSGERQISACDLAEQSGTITNEILSRMGARLERMVVGV